MNMIKVIYSAVLIVCFTYVSILKTGGESSKILIDVGHGQRFWKDPKMMNENDGQLKRVNYMTDELIKTVSKFNGELVYAQNEIAYDDLKQTDVLFIHIPSTQYSKKEVKSIQKYVKKGGSLFLTMDVDYWSSLKQTNVNDILEGFDISYEGKIPDSLSGGYTTKGTITKESLKLSYHGGRIVKGGVPFCYGNQTKAFPFGVYKEVGKGKIVVMGDGMISLYMTTWKDVSNYQCQEFMQSVFKWLLE
ncbi:motility-associated ABC transporter substrate-binding family protein [Flavivirga eckloniae]|uniref:IFT52 GIFT domain-containing protein n=1 Tax=Flavivirga eckloniae TaxID=1803846 RepID=A0A2K9PK09_9FLAO|nr:hypothetical protein [Flavivirga eckloniae]AUP77399.1 hypothetical protein C1H87_01145 [Flavivirga eckloniae]